MATINESPALEQSSSNSETEEMMVEVGSPTRRVTDAHINTTSLSDQMRFLKQFEALQDAKKDLELRESRKEKAYAWEHEELRTQFA